MNTPNRFRPSFILKIGIAFSILTLICSAHAIDAEYEREPISYSKAKADDPVAKLIAKISAGEVKLKFDKQFGYLSDFLKALNVPISSQMLVFSKTSLQKQLITPETPRAVYFNDNVYVGYCNHGKVLEVASSDPKLGAIFYTVSQTDAAKPVITRQTHNCLQCHDSSSLTLGVPGHIMRSLYADSDGMPIYNAGTYHTTHESPYNERWGGWYVSGTHGAIKHMGNTPIKNREDAEHADFSKGQNVTDLSRFFDTTNYLSPHSDIVALMVAEHQTTMHNLFTRANVEMQIALVQERDMNKALGEPPTRRSPSTLTRLKSLGEPLVKYLLFVDEPTLTAPIKGTSGFAEEFQKNGPKDSRGRTLRDFDLSTRLFKYPCSYLIYSPEFDQLPKLVRDYIIDRLSAIFAAKDDAEYKHLSAEDRQNIREILAETWKHAPAAWKKL